MSVVHFLLFIYSCLGTSRKPSISVVAFKCLRLVACALL